MIPSKAYASFSATKPLRPFRLERRDPRPDDIVIETLAADVSERGATRMDDQTSDASMEKRKKEGYF